MNTLFSGSSIGVGRTIRPRHLLTSFITALLVITLGACSKTNEDDSLNLLATVPADAEIVAVANLNTLVSQTGGSVKDGSIVKAEKLLSLVEENMKGKQAEAARWLLSPESGLECTSAVIFSYKSRPYLSMLISDEQKLRAGLDKFYPGEWLTDDKVSHKEDVAIMADRLWLLPSPDVAEVPTFANLSEVESFRSNPYAETLAKSSDAVSFWSSVEGLMKSSGSSFKDQAIIKMAMGMAFKSPSFITGSANLSADGVTGSLEVLDNDYKPARCELSMSKIDTGLVASLGGNANTVLALAVSPGLVRQALQLASSVGGNMPQAYASAIECLDGTIAYATNLSMADTSASANSAKGAVQTNGKNNAVLLQALQSLVGNVEIDGNTFRFADSGYGNGIAPLADVSKEFDGAWMGMASAFTLPDGKGKGIAYITLSPYEKSLRLNLKYLLK